MLQEAEPAKAVEASSAKIKRGSSPEVRQKRSLNAFRLILSYLPRAGHLSGSTQANADVCPGLATALAADQAASVERLLM